MKKVKIVVAASLMSLAVACKKGQNTQKNTVTTAADSTKVAADSTAAVNPDTFDVNSLPSNDKDHGSFPYFQIPDWLSDELSYGGDKNSEQSKMEVYTGNGFYPIEGKVFAKSYEMHPSGDIGKSIWDEYKFTSTFSKYFESLGAKKIFEGEILREALDALDKSKNRDDYAHEFVLPQQENKIVYGLKNKGKTIFFVIASDTSYGAIAVAENADFVQTVKPISASDIQNDLSTSGKSVLHINFDTDKSTLLPEGSAAVSEIEKVLKNDVNLKLQINGYTDNTGDAAHNLQLSKDRAAAVAGALAKAGIAASRLTSQGFGAANPIADNSTEQGKAENRRVELIKK